MARLREIIYERRRRRARGVNRERYRPVQMEVYGPDGAFLGAYGGRWDTRRRRFDGPADMAVRVQLAPSQHEAGPALLEWLARYCRIRNLMAAGGHTIDSAFSAVWQGEDEYYTVMLYGGRRGGKSWLACLKAAIFAVAVPGSRIVMVSAQQDHTQELYEVMLSLLPAEWRDWREAKRWLELINGTVIEFKTGRSAHLKLGRCDMVVINEGQEQKSNNKLDLGLNLADRGGICLITCNPPRSRIGAWVQTLFDDIESGKRPDCRAHFLDWQRNPHTSHKRILAEASGMTELERRREIDGDMRVPIGTVLLSSFGDHNIIDRIPVSWRDLDVTTQVCERWFGVSGITRMAGLDFDRMDGCSASAMRWYVRTRGGDLEDAIMVVFAAQRWEDREERYFGQDLIEWEDDYGRPIFESPEKTLFVGDGSGATQSTYRLRRSGEPHAVDPPSFVRLKDVGWLHIVPPDPVRDKNPRREDRFDCARDVLRPKWGMGPRALFVETAHEVIVANQNCPAEAETGNPRKRPREAHLVDTWTYPCWRRWGADWIARQHELRNDRVQAAQAVQVASRRPRAYGPR